MLNVITYLNTHSLEKLVEDYAIKVKRHTTYANLVLLKYNQIFSPMGEPIVQECRGLILDEAAGWSPVAYPYKKFFNHGEGHAASIDWPTARVLEKLDGSIITLYHYDGHWHVSTSGVPDASCTISGGLKSFNRLFLDTWDALGYTMPKDPEFCYMFELMTPENRVVVRHEKPRIVLHGARHMPTLQEFHPELIAFEQGWECVKSYPLANINEVVEAALGVDGLSGEGFIVVDANFNRLKVKSPHYVALHHMVDNVSPKRLLEKIVLENESDEFLAYFPEYAPLYYDIKGRLDALVENSEAVYEAVKDIEVQKDFALAIQNSPYKSACFAIRSGRVPDFATYYRGVMISSLMRMLGLKEEIPNGTE